MNTAAARPVSGQMQMSLAADYTMPLDTLAPDFPARAGKACYHGEERIRPGAQPANSEGEAHPWMTFASA